MQRSASAASVSSTGAPRCRLCWGEETDEAEGGSALITPCNCRGSVGFIHVHCLQHWLEVKRQQGVSRNRTVRCEVCNAKYNTAQIPTVPGRAPLLPNLWSDPFAIAATLHGAWRLYVVVSGMYYAFTTYASISRGTAARTHLLRMPRLAGTAAAGSTAGGSSSSSSGGGGAPRYQPAAVRARGAPGHHLSLKLPVGGGGGVCAGVGGAPRERVDGSLLATIRERFDKATMVQVYWYTGLMGLMPTPPNADAFAGMAVGATVGGMVAQLVFLPMLGSGKVAALGCSVKLLLRCLLRLLAAEACQARGYRVLAGFIRGIMQRWQRMRRRRQQQQQQQQAGVGGVGVEARG